MGKLKKSIGDTSRIVRYMWYAFGGIVVLVVAAFAMIAWGWIGYMPPIEDMENRLGDLFFRYGSNRPVLSKQE